VQLQVVDAAGAREAVTIPTAAFRLLVIILAQMAVELYRLMEGGTS